MLIRCKFSLKTLLQVLILPWILHINLSECYKVAVVNYHPIRSPSTFPRDVSVINAHEYQRLIERAQENGADLIIFPEYGLTTSEILDKTETHLDHYGLNIEPYLITNNPCNENETDEEKKLLSKLSCAAKTYKINIFANILEKNVIGNINKQDNDEYDYESYSDDSYSNEYYSTLIVINKEGQVIKSYRKINKIDRSVIKKGEAREVAEVENVKFALLISEDIFDVKLLKGFKAEGLKHFIHSSSYVSVAPFLTGASIRSGISKMYNINLISSGLLDSAYQGGSGIYVSGNGETLLNSMDKITTMIVADVKDDSSLELKYTYQENHKPETIMSKEDFSRYGDDFQAAPIGNDVNLCTKNGKSCCRFRTETNGTPEKYKYMMLIYSGTDFSGTGKSFTVCGITACTSEDPKHCGSWLKHGKNDNILPFAALSIEMELQKDNNDVLHIPSTLTSSLLPMPGDAYSMLAAGKSVKLQLEKKNTGNILSFGIVAVGSQAINNGKRNGYDGYNNNKSNANVINLNSLFFILIVAITCIVTRWRH